jgi:hypothetical protein
VRVLGSAVVAVFAVACINGGGDTEEPPPQSISSAAQTVADLIRVGTEPVWVRSGDLDGDGDEDLVVASIEQRRGGSVSYLEVFTRDQDGWRRVFDATGKAPPGGGAPEQMLIPPEEGFVSQSVRVLRLVDIAGDGLPEIVAGIQTFGAAPGPLEVWVISMEEDGSLTTEFYRASSRGGDVVRIRGNHLRFEYYVYRKDDPGCCPTFIETLIIGWNETTERIEVLDRTRRPSGLGLG